jgi:SAM-dependent methyltransferase
MKNLEINSGRVLVIGAGADPYRKIFKGASTYVTFDIQNQYGTIDIIGDAHSLPFQACSFDYVIAAELLEHCEHPELICKEAYRVLSHAGQFIATVPFMFHMHGDPHDYWRPTASGLELMIKKFSKKEIWLQGNRLHVIFDLILTSRPFKIALFPLRIFSHLFVFLKNKRPVTNMTTAPSGFMLIARK